MSTYDITATVETNDDRRADIYAAVVRALTECGVVVKLIDLDIKKEEK